MTIYSVLALSIHDGITIIRILIQDCSRTFRFYLILFFISSLRIISTSPINQISFTVTENCARNYVIGDMSIYRTSSNSSVPTKTYSMESIENEQFRDLFAINSQTGLIRVNRPVDRESICPQLSSTSGTCSLTLLVTILNDILNIIIFIVDENDNAPTFLQSTLSISIKESSPIGTKMYLSHSKDLDSLSNGVGDYSLTSEKGSDTFKLHYNSSVIYLELLHALDYELAEIYRLTLSVCDIGTPRLCSSQGITVAIIDVNDNYPMFSKPKYLAIIYEDHVLGDKVLQVTATDKDSRQFGIVRYRFSSINNEAKMYFKLDSISGKIYLLRPLVVRIRNFQFVVEAFDNGPIPNVNRTLVSVHVKDINNHSPEIKIRKSTFPTTIVKKGEHRSQVSFYENNQKNTDVVFVVVSDVDSDHNGQVHCAMGQSDNQHFQLQRFNRNINKVIYRLVALVSTNCEQYRRYSMVINCSDAGERPRTTLETIDVQILDVNEFYARFNQTLYSASIKENSATYTIPMPILDEDCNVDISIEIMDNYAKRHFKYVMSTHQLVLYSQLDYEDRKSIQFHVKIIDKGSDKKILSSTSSVSITVIDVNDNAPLLVDPRIFYVEENSRIGITIGNLRAHDSDQNQNAKTQFQKTKPISGDDVSSEYSLFFITSDGAIKLTKELDREKQELYLLTIEVSDFGSTPLSSTATVTIRVTDVNDNTPQWVFPNKHDHKINESIYVSEGAVITRVHAVDIDGAGNNNITYHILRETSKDFYLHPIKGELSFVSPPRSGMFTLELVALDNGRPVRSNQTKLIIYISERDGISSRTDILASRSYFTIVAVVPVLILICVLMLILCLLLIVRRRNTRTKNRRSQLNKNKNPETLVRKSSNVSNTNETLLKSNLMELQPVEVLTQTHRLETLDLTQTSSLPKVSYQCLVGNDLDVCSADSGQGASEEDFSNYFMLKTHENYRVGTCNQHCCSSLPENSIAHFICSTINHPILCSQPNQIYGDTHVPCPYDSPKSNSSSSNVHHNNKNAYNMSCVSPSCNRQ